MRVIEIIRSILEAIPVTLDAVVLVLALILALYGAIKAALEVPDLVKDWWDLIHHRDYRVKTTIVKAIIAENQTQIIKLRNVRVHTKREKVELDPVPMYGPGPSIKDHKAPLPPTHYSVPGRSLVVPGEKVNRFQIDFLPDEHLSPRHDHPILLSYFLDEKLETLFDPPFLQASQPVGSEQLVMEVYFPPTWRLKNATATVNTADPTSGKTIGTLDEGRASVKSYNFDFGDGRGDIDFIRAVIRKPPQDPNIRLDWEWEQTHLRRKTV